MAPLSNARFLAARIPAAELAVIAGAGHAYALEAPEQARDALLRWLESRDRIEPGPLRTDRLALLEPVTRAAGLPVGIARTGASLGALVRHRIAS